MSEQCLICYTPVSEPYSLCETCCETGWTCPLGTLSGEDVGTYLSMYRGVRRAPYSFWSDSQGLMRGALCLRFGVHHILGVHERSRLIELVSASTLRALHLMQWVRGQHFTCFAGFDTAFPDLGFLPWEIPNAPYDFWKQEHSAMAALRWFLHKQDWTPRACYEQLQSGAMGVRARLIECGLIQLYDTKAIYRLLSAIDHTLDQQSRMDKIHEDVRRRRQFIGLECPCCGKRFRSLPGHIRQSHPAFPTGDIAAMERETPDVKAKRSSASRVNWRRRQRRPSLVAGRGLSIPVELWKDTGWASLEMEEWAESLTIRPLLPVTGSWSVRVSTYREAAHMIITFPSDLVAGLRKDTVVRQVADQVFALRFRNDEARQSVWEWYQRRAKQQEEPETPGHDSLHRRQWLNLPDSGGGAA